jgi:4-hydroxybenzoate polyprenyltransferase
MLETVRLFATVSRAEFVLPNLVSLTMGLAWAGNPTMNLSGMLIATLLAFCVINLSSGIGAQVNTISDRELDSRDDRKKRLVESLERFGMRRLKSLLVLEFLSAIVLVSLLAYVQGKPVLILLWIAGIIFGCMYSAPPFRLKARSWMALGSLILALSIIPVSFVYYTITSELNPLFFISVAGLTLSIYGVIIPTEIRDYFGDTAMGVKTMTAHLGLVKASKLEIVLLSVGGFLTGTAFVLGFFDGHLAILSPIVLVIGVAVYFVLRKYRQLLILAKKYMLTKESAIAQDLVDLSANNPKWITLVTQVYSLVSIVLLVSKFLS